MMAKKTWYITNEQGVTYAREHGFAGDVGDQHELELDAKTEKAMVAAGWISEDKPKGGSK